ncbi:MAG TPA: YbaK/EbsC family protein [Candidatus Nanoarchaeia archaeon]|nr:YbaK/EbsC family protein [Candidatus Nanoarchaeia archaeon]
MGEDTLKAIRSLFQQHNIPFKEFHHLPVRTSEEAAKVRGVDIKTGAKAMVLKADEQFIMCVLSAAKRLDSGKLRTLLNVKKVRFANPEELLEKTKCEPGSVPPFGSLLGLPLYVDRSLLENESINFNVGLVTDSMSISTKDYLALVQATVEDFSE